MSNAPRAQARRRLIARPLARLAATALLAWTIAPPLPVAAAAPEAARETGAIRRVARLALMPTVRTVAASGDWALAVGVFTWDRGSSRKGADPETAVLLHRLPFGWQALTATDAYTRCEFDGWRRAYGIPAETSVRLASAAGLKFKTSPGECAMNSSDHARETGPRADVLAVRKLLRDGLMVPYVAVAGDYAMATANGDDVANVLFQRTGAGWQRVADFEDRVDVRKLTREFGLPTKTACAILPGGSADSQCRK